MKEFLLRLKGSNSVVLFTLLDGLQLVGSILYVNESAVKIVETDTNLVYIIPFSAVKYATYNLVGVETLENSKGVKVNEN